MEDYLSDGSAFPDEEEIKMPQVALHTRSR